MSENKSFYSFQQMTIITGIPMQTLEHQRRLQSIPWHANGYTLDEVRKILGPHVTFRTPAEIGGRAKKALALLNELLAMEQET